MKNDNYCVLYLVLKAKRGCKETRFLYTPLGDRKKSAERANIRPFRRSGVRRGGIFFFSKFASEFGA